MIFSNQYVDLYNSNEGKNDFREYVDKYALQHHITLEDALKHALVRNYGDYILNKNKGDKHYEFNHNLPTETIVNCGC